VQLEYRSFLLRLWQVKKNDETACRASLEDIDSGEKSGFEDLGALFAYLEGLYSEAPRLPDHAEEDYE